MAKEISYAGFDFQDTNWHTKDIIYRNLPEKEIDLERLARRDGFRVVNTFYSQKQISISGTVSSDTEANLRTLIDNMKKALYINEQELIIDDGGANVTWVCSPSEIKVPEEHYHITLIPYRISFVCQPFGHSGTLVTNTNSVSTASESSSIVITGSAGPRPIITWTVSGTPSSAITGITFENTTVQDTFSVTGLVLSGNGDYLELDTDEMTVVYNTGSGEVVTDFSGVIPLFLTSTNSYTMSITGGGASKTIIQSIAYYPAYL